MNRFTVSSLVVAVLTAISAHAQSCTVKYFGPATGATKTLQPGSILGSYMMTSRGDGVSLLSTSTVEFQGRTGEKTFAFTSKHETKTFVAIAGQPKSETESQPISVYWEGPTIPIKLPMFTIRLDQVNGETVVTVLSHPTEGPCDGTANPAVSAPTTRPSANGDPAALVGLLSLDVGELRRQGFDPRKPVIDSCAPVPSNPSTINCTGRSSATSAELCRANALVAIVGMADASKKNGGNGLYKVMCANHEIQVSYAPGGSVSVTETELATGTSVFQGDFTY